jgi:hypothetical protein
MRTALALAVLIAGEPPELHILDAVYGNPETGGMCDATLAVLDLCDERESCLISISNGICGDPARGALKQLFIAFKCGAYPAQTVAGPEGTVLRLSCVATRPKNAS